VRIGPDLLDENRSWQDKAAALGSGRDLSGR
jgi:hypothetical protein